MREGERAGFIEFENRLQCGNLLYCMPNERTVHHRQATRMHCTSARTHGNTYTRTHRQLHVNYEQHLGSVPPPPTALTDYRTRNGGRNGNDVDLNITLLIRQAICVVGCAPHRHPRQPNESNATMNAARGSSRTLWLRVGIFHT